MQAAELVSRAQVVTTARAYLGVPWVHQGRSRAGLDCGGLIVRVAQDLGLSDFDVSGYGRQPDGVMLRGYLQANAKRVARPAPGDILLMRFGRYPQHLGIRTDYGVVHTFAQVGRVVEHRLDGPWAARVVDAYAFPGMDPRWPL